MAPTRPPKVGRRRQQVKPVSVPYCSPQLVICASLGYTISLRMLSPQRNTIGYLPWPAGAYRRGWPHVLPSTRIVALHHAVMPYCWTRAEEIRRSRRARSPSPTVWCMPKPTQRARSTMCEAASTSSRLYWFRSGDRVEHDVLLLSGRDQPSSLGSVDIPPWNRQRRFPGGTLMMHGNSGSSLGAAPWSEFALQKQPCVDRPRSSICRHQCRSRQAPSEHARPVLGQRTMEFTS